MLISCLVFKRTNDPDKLQMFSVEHGRTFELDALFETAAKNVYAALLHPTNKPLGDEFEGVYTLDRTNLDV